MKAIIMIGLSFYFFIGMDLIYWKVNPYNKDINYTFSNGHGGTGVASSCKSTVGGNFCITQGYMIEVESFKEVER